MEKKKIIYIVLAQLSILLVFVLFAAGSSSSSKTSASEVGKYIRAGAQGGYCGSQGYTFAGYTDNCYSLCESKGYSSYCTGDATTACYCK
ncbi:MAG: hypothetical protein IJA09_00240 [Bacteroidales bacterium]|nr:hypothetical protein [Bacteroidales bacterium]MBQ3576559.1 hypothetical protein [Coprobacter sp.]